MRGLSAAALCAVAGSLMMPVMAAPGDAPLDGQILMIYPGERVDFYDSTRSVQDKLLSESPYYRAARSLGYSVSNVTTEEWADLTEEDFQFLKAIFISKLGTGTFADYSFLDTNKAVWGTAVTDESNIMLSGAPVSDTAVQVVDETDTDAVAAKRNARIILNNAINFIMKGTNTGLYMEVPMTTDDNTTPELQTSGETLDFLSGFGNFKLRVFGENPPSAAAGIEEVTADNQNVLTVVARHPDFPTLDSAIFSSWDRAARSVFAQRDDAFQPFYIASDVAGLEQFPWTGQAADDLTGPAVILVRAETVVPISATCGDNNLDTAADEECDSTDSTCNQEICLCKWGKDENDVCIAELGEECDLGQNNGVTGSTCTSECLCTFGGYTDSDGNYQCIEECGNQVLAGAEECDEGVFFNGQSLSLCDEECKCKYGLDDDSNCKTSLCGDQDVTGYEECDFTDNGAADSLCSETCTCKYGLAENPTDEVPCAAAPAAPSCGNNLFETGEQCDNDEDELCNEDCQCVYGPAENPTDEVPCAPAPAATCGNNVVESGEQCDNENEELCGEDCACLFGPAENPTDEIPCAAAPTVPPTCGNNVVESGEQCDSDSDLCDEDCQCIYGLATEPTADAPCAAAPTVPPTCGNNIVETGEQCDNEDDELCGEDCTCLFGPAEEPTADAPCATAPTTPPTCGNNVLESGEECDNDSDFCNEECECRHRDRYQEITTTASATETATRTESASITGDATTTEDITATETVTESADATATEDASATATESADVTVTETATESTDATATEDVSATATEDVTVTESAAATVTEDATMTESGTATDVATLTEGNTITSAIDATQTGTNTAGAQTTTSPSSPSGTDGPLPQEIQSEDGASFSFVGCAASSENYRGFTLEQELDDMDLNVCVTVCKDRLYSGAYKNQCYCGDELDESDVSVVGEAACDLTCPGNPLQNCGGDLDTTGKLRVRQVTAGILLSLYRRDIVDGSTSVAPTVVGTATISAPLPSQTAGGVTIINNNINNIDIDINIILIPFPGVDCLGQLVYIKSCDICKAGEKVTWAPKRCANDDDCAGTKVCKPEQCSDDNGRCNPSTSDYDFVVEKPCATCDGGVIYQPKEQGNAAPHSLEHQAQPRPQHPGAGDVPGQHAGDDVPVTAGSGRFSAFQSLVAGFAVNVILAGIFL
ncbi:hypothetical protein PspLS_07500 [Pyricularia sp. CBS 133598]|nr:hypothetical protein PspLS_07500 [Pyricularia sp. CBS 133598]